MTPRQATGAAPRVSVISIFYNSEKYFREAIDSVLDQDFEDFELLLVDDGSSDASTSIAKEYEARDPRVRYLDHPSHENRGMSATRNLGVRSAVGELVAFIDSDDRWRPFKLREQIELIDSMPYLDAVGGSVRFWRSHSGGKDVDALTAHVRNQPILPGEATVKIYPLGRANAPSMSDLLFRRLSILAVGGFETSFRGAYEDQAFLAKFYLNFAIYFTDTVWSDYRSHPDSCMAKVFGDGSYDQVRHQFLKWFEAYLASTAARDDLSIRRALDRALQRSADGSKQELSFRRLVRPFAPDFAVSAVRSARVARDRLKLLLAPRPAILMFHRVADEPLDPWGLAVAPDLFADQVEWLARNRTVLPLAELVALWRSNRLPRSAVALTFDDGYACNGETAAPILQNLRLPGTIFISPTLIGHDRELWWDDLGRIVRRTETERLKVGEDEIWVGARDPADDDWTFTHAPRTPRQQAYHRLWALLYALPPYDIEAAMRSLREQAGVIDTPRASHRLLTADQVRTLQSGIIDFGSHALTHPSLPLLNKSDKAREIAVSKQRCSEISGSECVALAYPYGDWDKESRDLVEEAGYECACKADGGSIRRTSDPFLLPRIQVENWNVAALAQRLGHA